MPSVSDSTSPRAPLRVAVTGGAGFIGSHISDAYLALGHQVLVIDDLSSGNRRQVPTAARFVQADIRSEDAAKALREFRPEVLCHHAAQIDIRRSAADPRYDADVNIVGLLSLVQVGLEHGLQRVVFASSGGAVYGEQDVFPADETHRTAPCSPYGAAKRSGELYLDVFRQVRGLHYVALRYSNVYGPRQSPHGEAGVVAIFTKRLLQGEPCVINGDGLQTRDFVNVKDVVRANVAALTTSFVGPVNIATGREANIVQIYEWLAKAAGVSSPAKFAEGKAAEQRRSVLSNALARDVLGWTPQVPLEAGIAETVAWFRAEAARG